MFSRGKAGSANKGLQAEDKRWLLHHTDFSEADLDRLYNIFKTDYPRGGMFRSQVNKYQHHSWNFFSFWETFNFSLHL